MSNFSDRLRLLMDLKGLTQGSVALRAGISQSTACRWLAGTAPRNAALNKLCASMGIRKKWLLSGEEPMHARTAVEDDLEHSDEPDTVAELLRKLDFESLCGVAEASLTQIRRARTALPLELSHLAHVVDEFRRRSTARGSTFPETNSAAEASQLYRNH